ncbi:MAG: ATP-binding protein [Rhodospirillaceae bacterium]
MEYSLSLLRSIIDSMEAQILVLDGEGRVVMVNAAWILYDLANGGARSREEDWLGHDYLQLCSWDDQTVNPQGHALRAALSELLTGTRSSFHMEVADHVPWDQRWFHLTASRLQADWQGVVISRVDITARKQAEGALSEERSYLNSILTCTNDLGIVTVNREMRIVYFNPVAERVFGYRKHEVIGRPIEVIHGEQGIPSSRVRQGLRLVDQTGEHVFESSAYRGAPGRSFETRITAIHGQNGEAVGYLVLSSDITERKSAEAQLIRAKEAAEEASRAKSAFLAMMSHELRTPMTGVIGMADFLSETPLNDDQKLYIDAMRSSARTLLTVLNDTLDYSKIEADRLALECVTFDAIAVTAETVLLFMAKAEENCCTIALDAGGLAALFVRGDPTRIKQVLGNLINNAVKFTRDGQVTVRVRHEDSGDTIRLRFEVEDTGIGISEADMANLFIPFSQAGKGTTRKFGGTGLGLAISKRLVELMGGEIGATSEFGRGSLFGFTCVVQPGHPGDLLVEPQEAVTVHPMSILLAEDNPINRMIVKIGLEQRGHRVAMVENGLQACETVATQPFDLILMDMQMPVMAGPEATRRIRTMPPPLSGIPIVALTADALAEHRTVYMNAGLTDFLTKPVEWSKVDAVLARIQNGVPAPCAPVAAPSATDPGIGHIPLVDRGLLIEIRTMMMPAAFSDLVSAFIPCSRDQLSLLKDAITQGNLPLANGAAHAIKGMFLNIGGTRVAALARQLQSCADVEAAATLLEAVAAAIDDTANELERLSAEG